MTQLNSSLKLLSLALLPLGGRVQTLYTALSTDNSLGQEKRYLNLGYWKNGATDLDQAGEALAELMAERAGLQAGDEVLDVGFGFADQDFFWLRQYGPRRICGVNITASQVEDATEQAAISGMSDRLQFAVGDAAKLPYPDKSFSVVFALESAFHFKTRDRFLAEAFRVLKPNGRLVLADLCAVDRKLPWKDRLLQIFGRSFWQIPAENLYPPRVYGERVAAAGFAEVDVTSIWKDVYPPFAKFARKRLQEAEVAKRMNPVFRRMLMSSLKARQQLDPHAMDYLLVSAKKKG